MRHPSVRAYRLAEPKGDGFHPYLNNDGAFLGLGTPLLKCERDAAGRRRWRVRPQAELERVLSAGYGIPVDLDGRMGALESVAKSLNEGKTAHAMMALLHARLPALPDEDAAAEMAKADSLVKFDPLQPRVPKGNSDGGQWTKEDGGESAASRTAARNPLLHPTQALVPPLFEPLETIRPFIENLRPRPDVAPYPQAPDVPNIFPYKEPLPRENPYPDDPECVAEWNAALLACGRYYAQGRFKPGYDGPGEDYFKCIWGQVSERCGGNPTA